MRPARRVRAGVTEWIEEQNLRAELGGAVGVVRAVATGLLVAGAKSFTHMITFVERYGAVLDGLLREAGPQVGRGLASALGTEGCICHIGCTSIQEPDTVDRRC